MWIVTKNYDVLECERLGNEDFITKAGKKCYDIKDVKKVGDRIEDICDKFAIRNTKKKIFTVLDNIDYDRFNWIADKNKGDEIFGCIIFPINDEGDEEEAFACEFDFVTRTFKPFQIELRIADEITDIDVQGEVI